MTPKRTKYRTSAIVTPASASRYLASTSVDWESRLGSTLCRSRWGRMERWRSKASARLSSSTRVMSRTTTLFWMNARETWSPGEQSNTTPLEAGRRLSAEKTCPAPPVGASDDFFTSSSSSEGCVLTLPGVASPPCQLGAGGLPGETGGDGGAGKGVSSVPSSISSMAVRGRQTIAQAAPAFAHLAPRWKSKTYFLESLIRIATISILPTLQ